jgi:hypothetical protein
MDEEDVRTSSNEVGQALVSGDIERVIAMLSDELKRNLGEVVALLPVPAREATVESVDRGGSGFAAVVRVIGEGDEVELQLRWKERDGEPRIVEVSHLSRVEREPAPTLEGVEAAEGDDAPPSRGSAQS